MDTDYGVGYCRGYSLRVSDWCIWYLAQGNKIMPRKTTKKPENKETYDKPITLHPLTPLEAIEALLKTKPMPKEQKKKPEEKKPA